MNEINNEKMRLNRLRQLLWETILMIWFITITLISVAFIDFIHYSPYLSTNKKITGCGLICFIILCVAITKTIFTVKELRRIQK